MKQKPARMRRPYCSSGNGTHNHRMPIPVSQRWNNRQVRWVHPDGQRLEPDRYTVELTPHTACKTFVVQNHYSGSMPAARFTIAMRDHEQDGRIVGVAVYGIPASRKVLTNPFNVLPESLQPAPYEESLELSRLVLLDDVPFNGESHMIAKCHRILRDQGIRAVITFADPVERIDHEGNIIKRGHIGTIYKASSFEPLGRSTPRTLRVLPDGRVFSDRTASKIRNGERGRNYAAQLLIDAGATPPAQGTPNADWMHTSFEQIGARKLRHPGNLRFGLCLDRQLNKIWRRSLPALNERQHHNLTESGDIENGAASLQGYSEHQQCG